MEQPHSYQIRIHSEQNDAPLLAVMENMIFRVCVIRKTTGFSAAKEITRQNSDNFAVL